MKTQAQKYLLSIEKSIQMLGIAASNRTTDNFKLGLSVIHFSDGSELFWQDDEIWINEDLKKTLI